MTLAINFKGADGFTDTLALINPEYIPNIGEDVNNNKKPLIRFYVERKAVYYEGNIVSIHITRFR